MQKHNFTFIPGEHYSISRGQIKDAVEECNKKKRRDLCFNISTMVIQQGNSGKIRCIYNRRQAMHNVENETGYELVFFQ